MNRLQYYRTQLGLTQQELAARLKTVGYDAPMISKLESGVVLPTVEAVNALEEVLKVSRYELYDIDTLRLLDYSDAKTPALTDFARHVAEMIPLGKEHAISRESLCDIVRASDRRVRQSIATARLHGYVIVNFQNGKGYYRTTDPAEIAKQRKQDFRRAFSILAPWGNKEVSP